MMRFAKIATLLIAVTIVSGCLKERAIKQTYAGFTPINRNDGWQTSTPEAEQMNRALLDEAFKLVYQDDRFMMARSLIVVRNGKIVAEAYPHDASDADRIANIQSCTKTFTGILTGIALHQGVLDSLQQKLSDVYPQHFENYPDKTDITLEDALTMRTGLAFDNSTETLGLYNADNSIDYVLSKDKLFPAGTVMHYNDGAPQLVSAAIHSRSGVTLNDFAGENLFEPLSITDWLWEQAPDGVTFGAFSLHLKPRDLAKVAQLLVQHGKWNNQQVLDSAWISLATKPHVSANFNGAPYGYYVWVHPAYNGFGGEGHGGQVFICVPEKNLAIVYTASGYTNEVLWDQINDVIGLVYESCE